MSCMTRIFKIIEVLFDIFVPFLEIKRMTLHKIGQQQLGKCYKVTRMKRYVGDSLPKFRDNLGKIDSI